MGRPKALDHTPFVKHPKALDTANTVVKKSYSYIPNFNI